MSGQRETGMGLILDLEELFLSQEFGQRPARLVSTAPASAASEPAQLEQVFLSDHFGHPEVVAEATRVVEEAAAARTVGAAVAALPGPTLVLLPGGARGGQRTIAAVSGVAAAALVVAGLAAGSAHGPGGPAPTQQAQGAPPSGAVLAPVPGSGTPPPPAAAAAGPVSPSPGTPAGSRGGVSGSAGPGRLVSSSSPNASVTAAGTGGAGGGVGGGGGGGGMLTTALGGVGSQASAVGSSVTAAVGGLGRVLPSAPAPQVPGTVTAAGNDVGGNSAPRVFASSLRA